MTQSIRAELQAEIYALVQKYSVHDDLNLSDDTPMDDLGVDSIDLMEIIFRLEETHGVEIDDLAMEGARTLGDIVDVSVKHLRKDA